MQQNSLDKSKKVEELTEEELELLKQAFHALFDGVPFEIIGITDADQLDGK